MEIEKYLLTELQKEANDVIINKSLTKTAHIKFVNNKVITIKNWASEDIDVFASINKKLVSTSLKHFTRKAADKLIREILAFAKLIEPNQEYNGIAKGPFKYKTIPKTYDKKIKNLDHNKILSQIISNAEKHGCRCSGVLETTESSDKLITSNKVKAIDKGSSIYFSTRIFKEDGSAHLVTVSRTLADFKFKKQLEETIELAQQSRNPEKIVPGKYDVLFHPLSFSNLINHVGEGCSIFNVESGLSCFSEKLGKKIASEQFNLINDGTLPNGMHTAKFDAEGTPTQKTKLIEKGILKNYLHNTSTAKKYKTKSTSSAGIISPMPHNLVVKAGSYSYDELVKSIKNGIIITNTWYTRFQNYSTGEFSTLPRDACFLIKNGRIITPIKNIRISENLLNIIKNIKTIGKQSQQTHSWDSDIPVITPHCVVSDVRITLPE